MPAIQETNGSRQPYRLPQDPPGARDLSYLLELVSPGARWPASVTVSEWSAAYQRAVDELAQARVDGSSPEEVGRLNDIVARAARVVHGRRPFRLAHVTDYFRKELPRQLRLALPFYLVALVLLTAGIFAGFFSAVTDSKIIRLIIPPEMIDNVDLLIRFHRGGFVPELLSPLMLNRHELLALIVLATGIIVGVGPALALFWYGLQIGALAVTYMRAGQLERFLAWHIACGLPGLIILSLSGAAGLCLGWAWLAPGLVSRRTALGQAGRMAAALSVVAMGCWFLELMFAGF